MLNKKYAKKLKKTIDKLQKVCYTKFKERGKGLNQRTVGSRSGEVGR